jgi:hypothetical protein
MTVETFTSDGTWVCPVGVTSLYKVEAVGSGGIGGIGNGTLGGGGGGGGAYAKTTVPGEITVTPGNSYPITIGVNPWPGTPGPAVFTGDGGKYLSADWAANASLATGGDKGSAIYCASNVTFSARDGYVGGNASTAAGVVGAASGWFDEYGSGGTGGAGGTGAGYGSPGNLPGGGGGGDGYLQTAGVGQIPGTGCIVLTYANASWAFNRSVAYNQTLAMAKIRRFKNYLPLSMVGTSPTIGMTTIDFGQIPTSYAWVDVTGLGDITSTGQVEAFMMADTTYDNTVEEHKLLAQVVKLTCTYPTNGIGFRIHAYLPDTTTTGNYKIRWVWV